MQQEFDELFADYSHRFETMRPAGTERDDECNFIPNNELPDPFEELTEYQARKQAIWCKYMAQAIKTKKIVSSVMLALEPKTAEEFAVLPSLLGHILEHTVRFNLPIEFQVCMLAFKKYLKAQVTEEALFAALTVKRERAADVKEKPGPNASIAQECYEGLCASLLEKSIGMIASNGQVYYYGSEQVDNLIKRAATHLSKPTHKKTALPTKKAALKSKPSYEGMIRLRVLRRMFPALLNKPVITTDFMSALNKLVL
uniref:Uncharacterized protein n=1 Tax=Clandestinovirus TaxID=2831644 RepID=A0A8F8KPX1_9VIRU|nr:hypothetical protein KOM_12_618 [Clandestinovirus]